MIAWPITLSEALALFDASAAVSIDEMLGEWRGTGVPTSHPMDGLLEAYGWYGKHFVDAETVHPLLFSAGNDRRVACNPRWMPIEQLWNQRFAHGALARALFGALKPMLRTRHPCARLRMMEHRGVVSATMVYDHLPINDTFRRIDADTLIGLMDMRGFSTPFFFRLSRVGAFGGTPGH